jgi:hypothetical protein
LLRREGKGDLQVFKLNSKGRGRERREGREGERGERERGEGSNFELSPLPTKNLIFCLQRQHTARSQTEDDRGLSLPKG